LGQLGLRNPLSNLGDFGRGLVQRFFVFFVLGDIEKEARLFEAGLILFPGIDDVLESRLFLKNSLGFFAVVPEVGTRNDLIELFDPLLLRL
jgi:hypothetical protein